MSTVDQDLVQSGFDVEALLGANYLRMLVQTAVDAGEIGTLFEKNGAQVILHSVQQFNRLYDPIPIEPLTDVPQSPDAFQTEILFGHPLGANLRLRLKLEVLNRPDLFPAPIDLMIKLAFDPAHMFDGEARAAFVVEVVDIVAEPFIFQKIEEETLLDKPALLLLVQGEVNRPIDLGASSKFKQIEKMEIAWHEADASHDAALGIYVNVRLRNGDESDQFVGPRGDLANARNFLPADEDIAMASRPGLYADLGKDLFSRSALKRPLGGFDHILRPNILSPTSKNIGNVNSISVGQAFGTGVGGGASVPLPINGLRIQMDGEYRDPKKLTLTDVTVTVHIKPVIKSDGTLTWDTDFGVDVDLLFEFLTLWGAMLTFILAGPIGAGIFLGAVFVAQIAADIYLGEKYDDRAARKADATLADLIPDRLTVKTRRWDPFYATKHQVVVKPSQAQFNAQGFMLCGKAFVGRELAPPEETVIRDDFRDQDNTILTAIYQVSDAEQVLADRALQAYGRHERTFVPPTPEEPTLFPLTFAQFAARANDPDGSLVAHPIPYFIAYVHKENNTIRHVLVISGTELAELRQAHRNAKSDEVLAQLTADEGPQIRQDVIDELSANGGAPTEEEIAAEVDRRLGDRLKQEMDDFEAPTPLEMAFSGELKSHVRWQLTPQEMFNLVTRTMISADSNLRFVKGPGGKVYLRDIRTHGFEGRDNLRQRPRYKPGPNGPEFLD